MEPRSYSLAPIGTNIALLAYGRTEGSVVVDPSLPVEDASAKFNSMTPGYYHSFGLLGRQSSLAFGVPYVWGTANALVIGVSRRAYRSGIADPRIRFAYILFGGPALSPQEFKTHHSKTVIGTSLTVSVPLGQYDPNLLVNVGTNRWAFKPEIGISRTLGAWVLELDLGSWLFLANPNFFHGQYREQAPLPSIQGHLSYTFRPGLWLALDGTFYGGGRTTVNGVHSNDRQENSRLGATFSLPLAHAQSLKFAVNRGATVRVGGNFTTISATYQFRWLTRR